MDQTLHSLKPVNPSDTVLVAIDFAEIWFDIDQNGQRRDTEKILPLFEQSMGWDATSRRKRQERLVSDLCIDLSDTAWLLHAPPIFYRPSATF